MSVYGAIGRTYDVSGDNEEPNYDWKGTVDRDTSARHDWSIISTHGVALLFIALRPNATLREIAEAAGVTERQIARVVKDLVEAKVLHMERHGRRNVYTLNENAFFRRPLLAHIKLERLFSAVLPELIESESINSP